MGSNESHASWSETPCNKRFTSRRWNATKALPAGGSGMAVAERHSTTKPMPHGLGASKTQRFVSAEPTISIPPPTKSCGVWLAAGSLWLAASRQLRRHPAYGRKPSAAKAPAPLLRTHAPQHHDRAATQARFNAAAATAATAATQAPYDTLLPRKPSTYNTLRRHLRTYDTQLRRNAPHYTGLPPRHVKATTTPLLLQLPRRPLTTHSNRAAATELRLLLLHATTAT